jgi:hypothetical protein
MRPTSDSDSLTGRKHPRGRKEPTRYRTAYVTPEEERVRKRPHHAKSGRPPNGASREQRAAWDKDMQRRAAASHKMVKVELMDYREKVRKAWRDYCRSKINDGSIATAAKEDFLDFTAPLPQQGDRWGDWEYDAKSLTLTYLREDYEVDVERCTSSAPTLDVIFQVAEKGWSTSKMLGDLVQAVRDLIDPQSNLCSFGKDKQFK